jgi:AcrR family transcriptional regulator
MRITADEKLATRQRILDVSADLFRSQGFESTTTRDIALAADIATGTLFNYFSTKEAILAVLVGEACDKARHDFVRRSVAGELEERLFALITAELRPLKPLRKFLAPVFERSFNPLAATQPESDDSRLRHLELVTTAARNCGYAELSPVALQLYWTLYTGALCFWSSDKSPKQEDTLALLDQSLSMFAAWLRTDRDSRC